MSLRPCLKSSAAQFSPAHPSTPRNAAGLDDDYNTNPLPYYQPYVHFPPSPSLSTTHSTHSRDTYDRSPIVVAPNACALPARGCPGRTYTLCSSSEPSLSPPASPTPHHRRSSHHASSGSIASNHNSYLSSPPRSRTPHPTSRPRTPHGVPPLIPDEGSSEESDGIASPPEYHQPARHSSAPSSHSLNSRLVSLDDHSPSKHRSRDHCLSSSPSSSFVAWGSDVNCLGGF